MSRAYPQLMRKSSSPAKERGRADNPSLPFETSGGLFGAWERFWFSPAEPFALHALRMLTGLLLLAWLLPLAGDVQAFFGLDGWFDRQAYAEAAHLPDGPPKPITWSLLYLAGSSHDAVRLVYWLSVAAVVLFTLGAGTRLTAALAWLVVMSFTANPLFDDEADSLLQMLSLYLAVGYLFLGLRGSLRSPLRLLFGPKDTLLLGRALPERDGPRESVAANLALRLVQVHLAILVVTSGLHKLQFGEWWSGEAPWYQLHRPLESSPAEAYQYAAGAGVYLSVINVMSFAALSWQIAFPLFAWRTGWFRVVLLGGAILGWVGTSWLYQNPLFGPALAIGCLAFLTPEEWEAVGEFLPRLRGRSSAEPGSGPALS